MENSVQLWITSGFLWKTNSPVDNSVDNSIEAFQSVENSVENFFCFFSGFWDLRVDTVSPYVIIIIKLGDCQLFTAEHVFGLRIYEELKNFPSFS